MTRLEMIHSMASEIVIFDSKIDFGKAQDLAGALLDRIEKEGMTPPERSITVTTNIQDGNCYSYTARNRSWETAK